MFGRKLAYPFRRTRNRYLRGRNETTDIQLGTLQGRDEKCARERRVVEEAVTNFSRKQEGTRWN